MYKFLVVNCGSGSCEKHCTYNGCAYGFKLLGKAVGGLACGYKVIKQNDGLALKEIGVG